MGLGSGIRKKPIPDSGSRVRIPDPQHCPKSFPTYGTVYRIIGGFLYAATSSLKRLTGRIFTISKCFHRSMPKLYLLLSPQQKSKNFSKIISAYTESTDLICKTFKKINDLLTQSL
jgi:hypothetical protein